ncbi:MAG: amino acid ABC transporter permease [Planctomycetota bacterium]|nr:amino acid ABC transporter permease [Planctomycetota bacterium]
MVREREDPFRRTLLVFLVMAVAAAVGGYWLRAQESGAPATENVPAAADAPPTAEEEFRDAPVRRFFFHDLALMSLLGAAKNTLLLTAESMPLAVVLGILLAIMRASRHRLLAWPAAGYIEVVRGTPLLVQVWLVHVSLAQLGQELHTKALTLQPFTTGIICLAGNYAAYEAEIIRAGLEAVDKGQREAALSIGMSERQAFYSIVLPQAFRIVVPPLINDLIAMLKDSCLVSVIGVPELLERARSIGKERGSSALLMVAAAVLYLIMSLACYALGKYLEKRLKVQGAHEVHVDQVHGH